jgi:hypothetical protein
LRHPVLMRGVERVVQEGTDRQPGRVGPVGRFAADAFQSTS